MGVQTVVGQGVAAVIFLGKKEVGYSEATGLYMIQYMLHKVSIALFSGILFLKDGEIFNELIRGKKSRREFLNEILDVLALTGGDSDYVK